MLILTRKPSESIVIDSNINLKLVEIRPGGAWLLLSVEGFTDKPLSLKDGDAITINKNIEVLVIEITRSFVRLGINAPRSVPVDRREIHELKIQREAAKSERRRVA